MRLDAFYSAAPDTDRRQIDFLIGEILGLKPLELPLATEPTAEESERIFAAIQKLKNGVPAQYITGHACFYGLDFEVNPGVLIPRFDTEPLVESILKYLAPQDTILDIGCGSGAIAVTLKYLMPSLQLHATDISAAALKTARRNAAKYNVKIQFYRADLFPQSALKYKAIVSNPPYICESEYEALDSSVKNYEPPYALLAGKDGLDYFRRIIDDANNHLQEGGILALEHGCHQQPALLRLTEYAGFKTLEKGTDLSAKPRFLITQKTRN